MDGEGGARLAPTVHDLEEPGGDAGTRDTDKRAVGLDFSGDVGGKVFWFAQGLWNRWDGFLDPDVDYKWFGGFAGVDYVPGGRWVYSVLWNHADAGDFAGTNTVYEGIDMRTLTFAASYYFMRNVKAIVEVNVDLLEKQRRTGPFFTASTRARFCFALSYAGSAVTAFPYEVAAAPKRPVCSNAIPRLLWNAATSFRSSTALAKYGSASSARFFSSSTRPRLFIDHASLPSSSIARVYASIASPVLPCA